MEFKYIKNDRDMPTKIGNEKEAICDRFKTHAIFRGSS